MQIVEFTADSLRFVDTLPAALPAQGFVWVFLERAELAEQLPRLQQAAQTLGGSALLDLHCQDLGNAAHPSHYDYTSVYDLLVFRRLATAEEIAARQSGTETPPPRHAMPAALQAFDRIHTMAVGFAVFDRLLVSVHPPQCIAARTFVRRMVADAQQSIDTTAARSRIPVSPADLVLRLVNGMVDSYLELRKELTLQMEQWQVGLLHTDARSADWNALMLARSQLHVLEDLCEEQLDAMQEWMDSLREQPVAASPASPALTEDQREALLVRARDVIEHIHRVMQHVRRLEQSAESVVQIHFSVQGNRTNDIMRVLTTLTAIFLPLNLIAGIFGMNFKDMPPLDWPHGFWLTIAAMGLISVVLSLWFWRKRYLRSH